MATGTWLEDSFYRGLKETESTSNVSDYIKDRRAESYQDVTSFDDAAGGGALISIYFCRFVPSDSSVKIII